MIGAPIPAIEVADDGDALRIWCPGSKVDAFYSIDDAGMGPHLLVDAIILPLSKKVQIEITEE